MAISDFFSGGNTPDYLSGLLDDEQLRRLKANAQQNAMLQFGLSALAQGGYSRTPVGLGEILGKAGMAGMQGYEQGIQSGIEGITTSQKLAALKQARDRDIQMRGLAKNLYKTIPAQYAEVQQPGMNVPVQAAPDAQAPNFATQYQPGQVTREEISPERQFVDTSVLGKMAALSDNPLTALTAQAELVPKLRAAGMVQEATNQPNPFEMWASGAQSPAVKKLAQQYSTSFQNNMMTDPEKINKTLETLATMDDKYIGRIELAADRKEARDASNQLRADAIAMQGQNQAAMRGIAQQGLALRQDMYNEKKEAKVTEKSKGAEQLDTVVGSLRDKYRQLQASGGIVDVNKPYYENIGAYLGTTGVGQTIGGAVGTSNQSIRNSIAQQRPLLLQAIKNATGMSAKQMDSNAELQMYLRSATDPTIDIQANLQALDNLESMFGVKLDGGKTPAATRSKKDILNQYGVR